MIAPESGVKGKWVDVKCDIIKEKLLYRMGREYEI